MDDNLVMFTNDLKAFKEEMDKLTYILNDDFGVLPEDGDIYKKKTATKQRQDTENPQIDSDTGSDLVVETPTGNDSGDKDAVNQMKKVMNKFNLVEGHLSSKEFITHHLGKSGEPTNNGRRKVVIPYQELRDSTINGDDDLGIGKVEDVDQLINLASQTLLRLFRHRKFEGSLKVPDSYSIYDPTVKGNLKVCLDILIKDASEREDIRYRSKKLMENLTSNDLSNSKFLSEPSRIPFSTAFQEVADKNNSKRIKGVSSENK